MYEMFSRWILRTILGNYHMEKDVNEKFASML